ncbi:MAG: trypsin-like peptidase domain-containing protein [Eubacterium sp.]|nr:trypsin-like peptidase domain-containing protein [Eubacterium sp.]
MKKVKSLLAILMALAVMMVSMVSAVPALATEDDVRATGSGILYLELYINDKPVSRGSCFLINDDTVITADHCVQLSKEEYDYLREVGYPKKTIDKTLEYYVVIQSDFKIKAKLVNSSENMDFAILKLSQPISNHNALKLRDSKEVQATETVFAVGYPAAKDTTEYFNEKDIIYEQGTINRTEYRTEEVHTGRTYFVKEKYGTVYVPLETSYVFKGNQFIYSGNTATGGNSGGPLVDANGNVIGVCTAGDSNSCFASAIDQIMEVLDTVNIPYTKAGTNTTPEPDSKEDDSSTTTKPAPETTTKPVKQDGISTGAIIGIVAAIAVVILIIIIALVMSKKKSTPQGPSNNGGFTPPAPPVAPAPPVGGPTMTGAGGAGSEGTTVLSSNAGDPNATTVLGASAATACLIRTSNNERINITKPYFKLGKDANRVDYCITGNPAVSRFHASIVSKNGQFFIVDNSTTNHTYVNDSMIPANVETQISDGARIRLADEKFEFKV